MLTRQNQGIIMDTFFRELPRCLADMYSEKEGTVRGFES